jgi:hypothetical protein
MLLREKPPRELLKPRLEKPPMWELPWELP